VRRIRFPDPVEAALIAEKAGADSIVAHLREDRRHIQDRDIKDIKEKIKGKFNLEMSIAKSIVDIACHLKPDRATLVPEKRGELTTEGGLNLKLNFDKIKRTVLRLKEENIVVSLFIEPSLKDVERSKKLLADAIEIHTGKYSNLTSNKLRNDELRKIKKTAVFAQQLGLAVYAGHGLNYENVRAIAKIATIEELNIGHAIISFSLFVGLTSAVRKMKKLINSAAVI
jgi:pyridoxine 5-phosphate synthase